MAGTSLHITDTLAAIADGTIPGVFTPDRMTFLFPTVRSTNSRGKFLFWMISVTHLGADGRPAPIEDTYLGESCRQLPAGHAGRIDAKSWQDEGDARTGTRPTLVTRGKRLRTAKPTNVLTQAFRDALGRHRARVRTSHRTGATDAGLIRPPPMLVKREGATKSTGLAVFMSEPTTAQHKLNGVRVVTFLAGLSSETFAAGVPASSRVVIYSRTGAMYPGFPKIREAARVALSTPPPVTVKWLQKWVPDANVHTAAAFRMYPHMTDPARNDATDRRRTVVYLDGEAYLAGRPLRTISGAARRAADSIDIEFHVFDCFFPGAMAAGVFLPSEARQEYLDLLMARFPAPEAGATPRFVRVPNESPATPDAARALADKYVCDGFEGLVLRRNSAPYEFGGNGYHSSGLIKIKPVYHDEFRVVGFFQGTRGKDVGAVIWECDVAAATGTDTRFRVVPKDMTYEQRYRVFRCLSQTVGLGVTRFDRDFRGRLLTVEFPERSTKTGKPTQAKACAFRLAADGGEGDFDPLNRLFVECGGTV